jgi:hypothetical protein
MVVYPLDFSFPCLGSISDFSQKAWMPKFWTMALTVKEEIGCQIKTT